LIGTVTGITVFIVSVWAYWRTSAIKSMDLRLALQKAAADADTALEDLSRLLPRALESRAAVCAALGTANTGAMTLFRSRYEQDLATIERLSSEWPHARMDYRKWKRADLEKHMVEIHVCRAQIMGLAGKYRWAVAADDRDREAIRHAAERQRDVQRERTDA
jgi:hypothetical protein